MISNVWRDGYGASVEAFTPGPEACPDGVTRRYVDLLISDRPGGDLIEFELRVAPAELAELAAMLAEVAEAVAR